MGGSSGKIAGNAGIAGRPAITSTNLMKIFVKKPS